MGRWIISWAIGILLIGVLLVVLYTRQDPPPPDQTGLRPSPDATTPAHIDVSPKTPGNSRESAHQAGPPTAYRQQITTRILPALYASNDLDSLIAGALIVRPQDHPYQRGDFLTLALGLNPDDLLTNVLTALACSDQLDRQDIESLCDANDFTARLVDLTGDNGWSWLMLADRADEPAERRRFLESAANATYYSDYSTELLSVMARALEPFTATDDDPLLLQGVNSVNAIIGHLRTETHCMDDIEASDRCRSIADQLSNSGSLAVVMQGYRLRELATGVQVPLPSERHPWWDQLTIGLFHDLLANDPSFRDTVNRHQTRYVEMDAIKQALVDYGHVEPDNQPPERIR